MTKLLDKAFKEASKLPAEEQDVFAKWVLDELASEKKWEEAFAGSEDVLGGLADEALNAHANGLTKPLDVDRL
ncbi:MAG: hypothetical protein NUW37_00750 [Planctomycetes bacterium]|nr:hypothetical protein [Planctomycetota bacterium]